MSDSNKELMQRIRELMEQQQPYLDSKLKQTDVATMLSTNRNAISCEPGRNFYVRASLTF